MTHNEIVSLINSIIDHGNHSYTHYSPTKFANMQMIILFLEDLPADGIVYIKHHNGINYNIEADNIGIDKENDSEYQVLFDFGADFGCESSGLITLYDDIEFESNDSLYFNIDFDGNEYRIIGDSEIWDIYVEEIKNTVTDCYDLKLDNIPDFVAFSIDWEQTAKNAYTDGYGHTFATYDGKETSSNGMWIFRTN